MDFRDIKEFFSDTFKYIVFIGVILFVVVYCFSLQQVLGSSMYPNLQNNDILLLNKLKYRFWNIERGDVVALQFEDTNYLVKRVIGLPGETVEIRNNQVYINGQVLEEEYLSDEVITDEFSLSEIGYDVIPEDMYFVLGDNREHSSDSRELGLVSKNNIIGETNLLIFPFNRIKLVK